MKKWKQLTCMLLVAVMLTGMFPAGAIVNSDVPETELPQLPMDTLMEVRMSVPSCKSITMVGARSIILWGT